jgi:hypothetical protein
LELNGNRYPAHRPPRHLYQPGDFVAQEVVLFPHIRVKDRDDIAPFAVPRVIAVRDPASCRHNCRCCEHRCVYVLIYTPPCACQRVRVRKHGRDIRLDYGKYEIEIEVEDGCIEIEYDD